MSTFRENPFNRLFQLSSTLLHRNPPSNNRRLFHRNTNNGDQNQNTTRSLAPYDRPQFRNKVVCNLNCRHCQENICTRGMRAILLGDSQIELFSTDLPPKSVELVDNDYVTETCRCRIQHFACLNCGSIIGYHVTQPCEICLDACNNGHFWMFYSDDIISSEQYLCKKSEKKLLWKHLFHNLIKDDIKNEISKLDLIKLDYLENISKGKINYETFCR